MARQIGKMLNSTEPKIVSGPEILDKFVGASEAAVRKLFEVKKKRWGCVVVWFKWLPFRKLKLSTPKKETTRTCTLSFLMKLMR